MLKTPLKVRTQLSTNVHAALVRFEACRLTIEIVSEIAPTTRRRDALFCSDEKESWQ
jgi:hypothetical protein